MKRIITLVFSLLGYIAAMACSCGIYEPNFYKNISSGKSICIAVFDSFDTDFELQGFYGEPGIFIIQEALHNFSLQPGDSIWVLGQDGLNCGEWLGYFSEGDTSFFMD